MKTEKISLSMSEKISFISNFSTMLAAGIPILEAVTSIQEDTKGNPKKLLVALREDLSQGKHVHTCLARFPNIFDKVTVNIIKASEEAGTLDTTLKDIKDNIKKESEFSDKIKSALMYPMFISIVFVGVLVMILVVVVPKISTVFLRLNVVLPLPTRILIYVSNLILYNTVPFAAGLVVLITAIVVIVKTQRRLVIHFFQMLPLVSNLVKEIDLTRFTRSLHLLLTAGIPITTALELTEDVVLRPDIRKIIAGTRAQVMAGKPLSEGLKGSRGKIPSLMVKIVEAGEKSGTLDKSLQDISEYLDYQVSNTLRTLTALLEPVMLVVVGIMIGGMMLAIIAPIYGLIGQVGNR